MNIQALALKAEEAETFLKSVANRHRLMILCELHRGECAVGELQERIGLSQSSLSQHLARLRADGLVTTRRQSQTIFYSLGSDHVRRLVGLMHDIYCAEPA
jgi:DNA-binding transcriptional ArsR family regulator